MAEKVRYPQIPSTVWWGIRSILQKTPKATVDERLLGVQLGVQEAAARAYVTELKNVGILSEDGKATQVAEKWRLDDSYHEAVIELIKNNYPESLIAVAPPDEAERQKAVYWFLREGLGKGSAGNKAATYLLISSPSPNDAPRGISKAQASGTSRVRTQAASEINKKSEHPKTLTTPTKNDDRRKPTRSPNSPPNIFPLNVNIQIHISADAGSEQIDSIFQAMRRYLYDAPDS